MSDPSGRTIAYGPCYGCGLLFAFDPDRVTSILVDPHTGRPPNVDKHARRITPDPAALARAQRLPLCPGCVELRDRALAT